MRARSGKISPRGGKGGRGKEKNMGDSRGAFTARWREVAIDKRSSASDEREGIIAKSHML